MDPSPKKMDDPHWSALQTCVGMNYTLCTDVKLQWKVCQQGNGCSCRETPGCGCGRPLCWDCPCPHALPNMLDSDFCKVAEAWWSFWIMPPARINLCCLHQPPPTPHPNWLNLSSFSQNLILILRSLSQWVALQSVQSYKPKTWEMPVVWRSSHVISQQVPRLLIS